MVLHSQPMEVHGRLTVRDFSKTGQSAVATYVSGLQEQQPSDPEFLEDKD